MREGLERPQFQSPADEIAYLRERIATRERELLGRGSVIDQADHESVARAELRDYGEHAPEAVLHASRIVPENIAAGLAEQMKSARHTVEEVIHIAEEHGIRNVLTAMERLDDSFLVDCAHDALIAHLRVGKQVAILKRERRCGVYFT